MNPPRRALPPAVAHLVLVRCNTRCRRRIVPSAFQHSSRARLLLAWTAVMTHRSCNTSRTVSTRTSSIGFSMISHLSSAISATPTSVPTIRRILGCHRRHRSVSGSPRRYATSRLPSTHLKKFVLSASTASHSLSSFQQVDLFMKHSETSNHAMERTADRCAFTFKKRARPPSLILFSLGVASRIP
jgi:hypothetical protein